jgi:transcriptional regulator with XRE-family HTH domain
MAHFPNKLRQLRLERKWSLETVAFEVGTSLNYVSQMERGTRQMTPKWARKFAAVFGISIADLLNAEDNPHALNVEESELIQRYRRASATQKQMIAGVMDVVIPYQSEERSEEDRPKAA